MLINGFFIVSVKIFTKGSHIHVENSGFNIVTAFFLGQHGFFECKHAADRGTIVSFLSSIPGPHTLHPGNLFSRFAIGWPFDFSIKCAGPADNALKSKGTNHIGRHSP